MSRSDRWILINEAWWMLQKNYWIDRIYRRYISTIKATNCRQNLANGWICGHMSLMVQYVVPPSVNRKQSLKRCFWREIPSFDLRNLFIDGDLPTRIVPTLPERASPKCDLFIALVVVGCPIFPWRPRFCLCCIEHRDDRLSVRVRHYHIVSVEQNDNLARLV